MIPDLAGSGRRIYSLVSVPHWASPSRAGSPHSTAYYPFLVHRHGILPKPSFRPHLTVGTLVSANGSCGQARRGLSPPRFAPCWAHADDGPLGGRGCGEKGRGSPGTTAGGWIGPAEWGDHWSSRWRRERSGRSRQRIQAGSLVGSILSDRKGEPILPMLAQVCS